MGPLRPAAKGPEEDPSVLLLPRHLAFCHTQAHCVQTARKVGRDDDFSFPRFAAVTAAANSAGYIADAP